MNKPLLNKDILDLSDCEVKILMMIRNMRLFDKVEIKYSKQGELSWQLTQSDRGVYLRDM